MRIVDVCEFYSANSGGVRSYLDRKMELLAERGHELFVVAAGDEDRFEPRRGGGIAWVAAPAMPFDRNYRLHWGAEPVHAWLDRLAPDVVEASSPWRPAWIVDGWRGRAHRSFMLHSDLLASYPRRWFGGVAGRDRIDRTFDWFNAYLNRLATRYGAITTVGPHLAEALSSRGVGPVRCVPLGVDTSRFSPERRDPAMRAALLARCGLPPDADLVVGVGRHHPEKRWPMVVAAAQAAARARPLALVLVGDGVDRPAVMRAIAGDPQILPLAATRDRDALATLLASADALVHGCESETYGMIAAEAVASGLPVVAPATGGCAMVAVPGASALYAAGDRSAATDALLSLLARDRAVVRHVAAKAAGRVRSDRDHVDDLVAVYGAELGCVRRSA